MLPNEVLLTFVLVLGIIGAIYYGIAVLVYRSNRGIEPSPAVEVEPVAWATR